MGIKFLCPNGHKLHVKSYLSGKKAICPKCGERVMVPVADATDASDSDAEMLGESDGSAPLSLTSSSMTVGDESVSLELGGSSAIAAGSVAAPPATGSIPQPPSADVSPPLAAPPRDPIDEDPDAVWYVRPAAGGQFGPASGTIMRGWLTEGRIAGSSLVWRAGWPQWLSAAAVFPQLGAPALQPTASARPVAAMVATAPAAAIPQAVPGAMTAEPPGAGVSSSESLLAVAARKRRRRNDLSLMFSAGLVVVSVILVIVLIVVFRAKTLDEPPAAKETSKADAPAAN